MAYTELASSLPLSAISPIVLLFFSGCPFAVGGRIASVVINTFDGVQWRRLAPYVGKERFVAVSPPVTNRDASAAVVLPLPEVGIGAALNHAVPCLVFTGTIFALAVRGVCGADDFSIETSAGLSGPAEQRIAQNNPISAAIAATVPVVSVVFSERVLLRKISSFYKRDNGQATKTTTYGNEILGHGDLQQGSVSSDGRTSHRSAVAILYHGMDRWPTKNSFSM